MVKKKWIQKAIPSSHRGNLKHALGVPKGEKIPAKKMQMAERSKSPKVRKEVALAKTLSKMRKKK